MDVFFKLLYRLIPLYLLIFLGYLAVKQLKINKESIARLLIYIIVPGVFFHSALTVELKTSYFFLPLLFFLMASIIALLFYYMGKHIYGTDSSKNILAFAAGAGNTGYFGLPVVGYILGDKAFALATFAVMGMVVFENTLGFYLTARGNFTAKESLVKVFKLPVIYFFLLGLLLNYVNLMPPASFVRLLQYFKGTYTVLGMMIIGMGLAGIRLSHLDLKFLSLTFTAKFIIWPLLALLIIFLDKTHGHIFDTLSHHILLILSAVPIAANTVVFATELKVQPGKASLAVLLTTLFSVVFIPLIVIRFIQ